MARTSKKNAASEAAVVGVLQPSGTAERIDQISSRIRYWTGVAVGTDGAEHPVFGNRDTRTDNVTLFTEVNGQRVKCGHLDRVNNHYEGKLGSSDIGAYFRSLERGRKSAQRIVILKLEDMNTSKPADEQDAPQRKSLSDAVAELGEVRAQSAEKIADEEVPF